MGWGYRDYYRPYVSVAKRRANATRELKKLEKKGRALAPIKIEGRKIGTTFWGKAWCDHLESFSDFSNRLERGRTYARNGSVVDLQIAPGTITAMVSGSTLYTVTIAIKPLAAKLWKTLQGQCAGQINSIVELLQGRLSSGVMAVMTRREDALFPDPHQITMKCSCPDYAGMCKHIAAVLYGVGARLDHEPDLLFKLRGVDHMELIAAAGDVDAITNQGPAQTVTIAADQLSDVFGIDLDIGPPAAVAAAPAIAKPRRARKSTEKPAVHAKPPARPAAPRERAAAEHPPARPRKPTRRKMPRD